MSIIKRLSIVQTVTVMLVMALFTVTLTSFIQKRLVQRTEKELAQQVELVINSMSSFDSALVDSAVKLSSVFRTYFPGSFSLNEQKMVPAGEKSVPTLTAGSTAINNSTEFVDRFTSVTKAVSAVFVRSGEELVRVSTSIKKEDGSRTVGAVLDKTHPGYENLLKGEVYVGKATLFGKDYMARYEPIKDSSGKVIAVLGIALEFSDSLKALKEKILKIKFGKTGYVYAIDANEGAQKGLFQIHPSLAGKSSIGIKDANGREFLEEVVKKKEGITRYHWIDKAAGKTSAEEKVVVYRHLKEWNWVVAAGASMDELNPEGPLMRNAMICATLVVLVILIIVFVFIVRRWISAPLAILLDKTNLLASGDFRNITDVKSDAPKSDDEVVQLSQGVQHMAYELRCLIDSINSSAMEVAAAAEQVRSSAERIATGTEEVVAQVSTVATSGEEMSATSENIALNCQLAAEGAQRASESAHNGEDVVKHTMNVMGEIALKVQETAKTVESLGERSDQIGEIIGTIEDIADQTNLLALNAAIEAARAGEQGRGFAVVADEVRALAERTTSATREIGEMIKTIQRETKGAVSAMEEGVRQVEEGTMEAARSGEALRDILQQVNAVSMQVSQIATAAEEQTATTGEISSNMHQINEAVQHTSQGSHESAVAAAQLNGNAESLKRLVQRFKL
jgi:methyl-accepting chemotaxis protein